MELLRNISLFFVLLSHSSSCLLVRVCGTFSVFFLFDSIEINKWTLPLINGKRNRIGCHTKLDSNSDSVCVWHVISYCIYKSLYWMSSDKIIQSKSRWYVNYQAFVLLNVCGWALDYVEHASIEKCLRFGVVYSLRDFFFFAVAYLLFSSSFRQQNTLDATVFRVTTDFIKFDPSAHTHTQMATVSFQQNKTMKCNNNNNQIKQKIDK